MSTKRGPKMQNPTHEQVLQFVRENSTPFVTTADVEEQFPEVARRTLNNRLNDLHSRGEIEKRMIGCNTAVWYVRD